MRLAATIIDGVCVDAGENLQEQKMAVKAILSKYGSGEKRAYVIYSSQRTATRKRVNLPKDKDIQDVYNEAKEDAKKADAKAKKVRENEEKKIKADAKKAKELRAAKRNTSKAKNHPRDKK